MTFRTQYARMALGQAQDNTGGTYYGKPKQSSSMLIVTGSMKVEYPLITEEVSEAYVKPVHRQLQP